MTKLATGLCCKNRLKSTPHVRPVNQLLSLRNSSTHYKFYRLLKTLAILTIKRYGITIVNKPLTLGVPP